MILNQGRIFQGGGWTFSAYYDMVEIRNGVEMADMEENGGLGLDKRGIRVELVDMVYFLKWGGGYKGGVSFEMGGNAPFIIV